MAVKMSLREYLGLGTPIERRSGAAEADSPGVGCRSSPKKDGHPGVALRPSGARSKYRAQRCEVDGETLDSKAEGKRFAELKILERAGEISDLERQPAFRFEIGGELMFTYRADFGYHSSGVRVIEDVKGVRTPVYRLKKKIIEAHHGVEIIEIGVGPKPNGKKKITRKPGNRRSFT